MRECGYTLITGGAGFIGANLANTLAAEGERVVVLDSLSRPGVEDNLRWLLVRHGARVRIEIGDVTDAARVAPLVQGARRVYHLAAQVAVTRSIGDPGLDLRTNLLGTFNLLEAARAIAEPPPILFTSTNKVYGELAALPIERGDEGYRYAGDRRGVSEATPLDFHSPYGCSKGAADQYVRDYARIYGLPTVVFRMSCVYGPRQLGTEDQGWVAHFARAMLEESPITIFGDGLQVRDVLWIDDLLAAMHAAMERLDRTTGEVYNVGGGPANAITIRGVIERLEEIAGLPARVRIAPWRPGDQRVYISDTAKVEDHLGWRPTTSPGEGLERLVSWLKEADLSRPVRPLRPARHTPSAAHAAL